MSTTRQNLDEIVQDAYDIFAKYTVQHPIVGSPISVTEAMQQKLASVAMREATGEHLYRYLFKAITTWGTVDDFKHYLPRFLDLVVDDFESLQWGNMVFSKLSEAKYRQWAVEERQVIDVYLETLWLYILEVFSSRTMDAWEFYLLGIHKDKDSLLQVWDEQLDATAPVLHLAETVTRDIVFKKHEIRSIIDLRWYLHPLKQDRIESVFFEVTDERQLQYLDTASRYLKWTRDYFA